MPRGKRMRMPRQVRRAQQKKNPTEAEADADALVESEVPNDVAAEDPVEEQNDEGEDAADVVETSEGEEVQGADVEETPRRRNRKRRRRSNRGEPSSTPNSSQKEKKEIKIAGMIFMCNAVTKKDCFKYGVFGYPEQKKDIVEQVKRGMKLFLFDVDTKHLFGVYEASSRGGMDLVPEAFRESDRKFPAQVRFRIHKDCIPLEENDFKQAIKDNYNNGNRFRSELSSEQVGKLMRLFRSLDSDGTPQPRRDGDARREPASRDARRAPVSRDARREPVSRAARRGPYQDPRARGSARHVSRAAPPEPVREPIYSREFTPLYARERPPIDLDYYRAQPSYISAASQIARAEAEGRRRYLDNLYLEQTSMISKRPLLHDPLYRGADYQREMPFSSYGGSRISGLPY